jgi:hypothetical protein
MRIAGELLDFYRRRAARVVTTRIHCAMPCFAMGIPTVFVGARDDRTEALTMIGVPRPELPLWRQSSIDELPFVAPDFEERKAAIAHDLRARLSAAGLDVV